MTVKKALWCVFLAMAGWSARLGQPFSLPEEGAGGNDVKTIVARNIQAAGGAMSLAAVRTLSFQHGVADYALDSNNRLKVRYVLSQPGVYETLIVDERGARRNQLGRVSDLAGIERDQWLALARLFGGCFTLKNFSGMLSYAGWRTYGAERYHVLAATFGSLRGEIYVDAADSLVKRLVLSGRDESGEHWEACHELSGTAVVGGITLPARMYRAQVGVGGTSSPHAQPIGNMRINADFASDFFSDLSVNAGQAAAGPGWIQGNVLAAYFEEEPFVMVFTNWTEEEVRQAGWQNGDLLVITSGGAEFETRFYFSEDKADPAHRVYEPGNSLFTHNPRIPMFYAQFNTCTPREKFELLKAKIKLLAPISGRKKK